MALYFHAGFALCSLAATTAAAAANYYVDPSLGRDNLDGRAATVSGASGPFQTLGRLSQVALTAGDTVNLRCGAVWAETLRLTANGTASAPVVIRPYPAPCTAPPMVDGLVKWSGVPTVSPGNVFGIRLPSPLLANSDFTSGTQGWTLWSPLGDATMRVEATCAPNGGACLRVRSGGGSQNTVLASSSSAIFSRGSYTVKAVVKASAGARLRMQVRRGSSPYDTVGGTVSITGTGQWQSVSASFVATADVGDARVDFDIPPGSGQIDLDGVQLEQVASGVPLLVVHGGVPLVAAHHPNRGANPADATSPYLTLPVDSDVTPYAGGSGSTFVTAGADLVVPGGLSRLIGATLRVRTNAWMIEDRQVVSVNGSRLVLDRPTTYPLKAGWGYYLVGQTWMVDDLDEWSWDAGSKTATVKTRARVSPQDPPSFSVLTTCVHLVGVRYARVEDLRVRGCKTGVNAEATTGLTLQRVSISDVAADGVRAIAASQLKFLNGRVERAGEHGIVGVLPNQTLASAMEVSGSQFRDVGVLRSAGAIVSLPIGNVGAVVAGREALVTRNLINGAGYHGIRTHGTSQVHENVVSDACLVIDDCGGIYVYGSVQGTVIRNNFVSDVVGNTQGRPVGSSSMAKGIFLDDGSNGVTVNNNTVWNAESGVLLHNAFNNVIQGNTLYGNRRQQVWLYEDTNRRRSAGDITGNRINGNKFFSNTPVASVVQKSLFGSPSEFASFDRNRYSELLSRRVVTEEWPSGGSSYAFVDWQGAVTPAGTPRNLEPSGSVVLPTGYAGYQVLGGNLIKPPVIGTASGWTPWNDRSPLAVAVAATCGSTVCVNVSAGVSTSLVASPPTSVVAGNWYRVTVDARLVGPPQSLSLTVRRGGGGSNGYESLQGPVEVIALDSTKKRFSFSFKSSATVRQADPVTQDIGARLYFEGLVPGTTLIISDAEMVPISPATATSLSQLLVNQTGSGISLNCPDSGSLASRCSQYVNFESGSPVTWPVALAPYTSAVVYLRDTSLTDSDGDGIADHQDQCPGTPVSRPTNAAGCSL